MENRRKALLIALTILIAIILIVIGNQILNPKSEVTNSAQNDIDTTELSSFNNGFSKLCGNKKNKTDVMVMAKQIIENNAANEEHIIKMSFYIQEGNSSLEVVEATDIINQINYLSDGGSYNMLPQYGYDGYINMIKVF